MSKKTWVVYNVNTLRQHRTWKQSTRAHQQAEQLGPDYTVASEDEYVKLTEGKTRTVRNLMTGEQVEIDINAPLCCDPSSETYWSM